MIARPYRGCWEPSRRRRELRRRSLEVSSCNVSILKSHQNKLKELQVQNKPIPASPNFQRRLQHHHCRVVLRLISVILLKLCAGWFHVILHCLIFILILIVWLPEPGAPGRWQRWWRRGTCPVSSSGAVCRLVQGCLGSKYHEDVIWWYDDMGVRWTVCVYAGVKLKHVSVWIGASEPPIREGGGR